MGLPYDYERLAKYYDVLESGLGDGTNAFLAKVLRRHGARRVLDLTCGTGAQALWLAGRGFDVVGSDISPGMLRIAREKARRENLRIRLCAGDMRKVRLGTFDAAITMFNAVGHLTKPEFELAVRNIGRNLKSGGLYIFDIFNLDRMKNGNFRTYRFIDTATEVGGTIIVRSNKNTLDGKNGVMHINQETIVQEGHGRQDIFKQRWTMQIYTAGELRGMLERNGFDVIGQYAIDGSRFLRLKSGSVLTVARKL